MRVASLLFALLGFVAPGEAGAFPRVSALQGFASYEVSCFAPCRAFPVFSPGGGLAETTREPAFSLLAYAQSYKILQNPKAVQFPCSNISSFPILAISPLRQRP